MLGNTSSGQIDILSKEKSIAIDLECENNLHHYGVFISLIQISSPTTHWIVDVLKLKQIDCLINILEDTTIEIIIHDVSFDLRILAKQFNCYPQHIFDTQLAALLLGKEKVGLKNLLEEYCNIGKESKFQMADWTRRPLTKAMLEYAAKDSMYLHKVKESLLKDLTKKGRLEWVKEEMVYLNTIRFEYPTPQWHDVKCVKSTEAEVMGRIKELHAVRESIAKKVDRPVHFIFNNKQLIEFATTPPDWDTVKRVHPVVRRSAHRFKKALDQAKSTQEAAKTQNSAALFPLMLLQLDNKTYVK